MAEKRVIRFEESSLPQNISISLATNEGIGLDADFVTVLFKVAVESVSQYLALKKAKEEPTALVIQDLKGNFIFAAIVTYTPAEEGADEDKGNWNLSFTFNQEDVKPETRIIHNNDSTFRSVLGEYSLKNNFRLNNATYADTAIVHLFDKLKQFLDLEADEISVVLEGYFVAESEFEGKEKIFIITPDEMQKQNIKSDATL